MRRRVSIVVIAGCAAVLSGLWCFPTVLLPPLARWLDVGTEPEQAEFVMVLPGRENTRPFMAAALMNVGLVEAAVIPQVVDPPDVQDGIGVGEHEIIRRVLQHQGVSEDRIVMLRGSTDSTYGDATRLREFLDSRPQARTIVVTSDYHSRRARWAFTRVLGARMKRVRFVSAPSDSFELDDWWRSEEGFCTITCEYFKLAAYWVKYTRLTYWAIAGVAIAAVWIAWRRIGPSGGAHAPPPRQSHSRPIGAAEQQFTSGESDAPA